MAELAAGAVAAEEIVSTSLQAGLAAYVVSQPTVPLKATFGQIATTPSDDDRLSLDRSRHSLTIVKDKACIFGGHLGRTSLASNEVHMVSLLAQPDAEKRADVQYAVIPALASAEDGTVSEQSPHSPVPSPRSGHAACALNICVAIFGGLDQHGEVLDEGGRLWLFNTASLNWECIRADPAPPPRAHAVLGSYNNRLVLYGGLAPSGEALRDVWHFDYSTRKWQSLPDAPVADAQATVCNSTLHLLGYPSKLSCELHSLPLPAPTSSNPASAGNWITETIPTNPLVSSPSQHQGSMVLPLAFGHGRNFLLYLLGANNPDAWTLQLPSSKPTATHPSHAGASIKDGIRSAVGAKTGAMEWCKVDIQVPGDVDKAPDGTSGKLHPGPRAWAAGDVTADGRSVVVCGGVFGGATEGDDEVRGNGDVWMIRFT